MYVNPYSRDYQNSLYSTMRELEKREETDGSTSRKSSEETSGDWRGRIRSEIESLLDEIPKGDDDKLSFEDIRDYRAKLDEEFDDSVKKDLKALGVDVSRKFTLVHDGATGKVTVDGNHPDKAIIDKYFEDNPDKVNDFKKLLQLDKLVSYTRPQQTLSQNDFKAQMQAKSMAWWLSSNMDASSWFSNGGMMFGAGAAYQSLNLRV